VDADEALVDAVVALEVGELLDEGVSGSLGQVVDVREVVLHRLAGLVEVLVGPELADGLAHRRLTGREGLLLDVPHEPAVVVGHLGRALDRRRAADDGLRLDVLQDRLAGDLAQRLGRQPDLRLVGGIVGPLVAPFPGLVRGSLLGRPARQRVVGDVVVQVHETRVDRAAGLERQRVIEAGGRGRAALLHRGDFLVGTDVERAVIDDGRVVVERHDASE
jgi:hypothetical protein